MKHILSIIIFLGLSYTSIAQDSLIVKANQHYSNGEFDKAVTLYEEVLNSQMVSAEVYYNLGNSYYKTGYYTRAIINYERAILLAPDDDDIRFNLELANQYIQDAIKPIPKVFIVRWWGNLSNNFSVDEWARISIVSFILVLILAGVFIFTTSVSFKKLSFWFAILLVVITIFSYNFAARQERQLTSQNYAIIIQPSVTVKSSPSEGGTNLFLIHEGLKVEIKEKLGSWVQIRLADGNQGWLPDNSIEGI